MRTIIALILLSVLVGPLAKTIMAADAHHAYNRPTVSFSPPTFSVSFGSTVTLCATVTPPRKASLFMNASAWKNADDAPGVFTTTPGTSPSCSGEGKVFLAVKSNWDIDDCLPKGRVRAVLKNRNTYYDAGSAEGTVLLPDGTQSTFYQSGVGPSDVAYNVRFLSSQGGPVNFNGLPVRESWNVLPPNTCGMGGSEQNWTIGTYSTGQPAPQNTIDDGNGGWPIPPNCRSVVWQTFLIGPCIIPHTPIEITVWSVNGDAHVTRNDCVGDHCVGGE